MSISLISHTVNLINTDKVIQTGIHGINLPVSGDLPTYLLPYLFDKSELHPDWNSLRIYEYAEGNTMVMCSLNEAHSTVPHKCTMSFEHDPRTILSKVLVAAHIVAGVSGLASELTMKDCGFILEKVTHVGLARHNIIGKFWRYIHG